MGERTYPKIASDEFEQVRAAMARRGLSMTTLDDALERYKAFRADPAGEFTKILKPFPIRGFLEPLYRVRICRRGRPWLKLSFGVGPRCPGFQSWMPLCRHATYSLSDEFLAGLRQPRWLLMRGVPVVRETP